MICESKSSFMITLKYLLLRETNGHLIRQSFLQCSSGNKLGLILELLNTREWNWTVLIFFFFTHSLANPYFRLQILHILMIMASCRSKFNWLRNSLYLWWICRLSKRTWRIHQIDHKKIRTSYTNQGYLVAG